jgi:hypothetical protein
MSANSLSGYRNAGAAVLDTLNVMNVTVQGIP